jgi:hypothetical protein
LVLLRKDKSLVVIKQADSQKEISKDGNIKVPDFLTLLSKLAAYGLSSQSIKLLENYLTGRKQQIKLQGVVSSWQILQKGVPHSSIMRPLLFNIFKSQ